MYIQYIPFLKVLKKSNSWFEISFGTVNSCQFSCSKYDLGFKLDCGFSVSFSLNNCNSAKDAFRTYVHKEH